MKRRRRQSRRAAEKLDALADKAAAKGGLAGEARRRARRRRRFLRQLKPSLMVRACEGRARRRTPSPATGGRVRARPARSSTAEVGKRGPNPFVVAGSAFGVGTVLAKLIDWRGHAHPRR